jgi:uncharacterized membrane protein
MKTPISTLGYAMNDELIVKLAIAALFLACVVLIIYMIRKRVKSIDITVGKLRASTKTQDADLISVSNVEQRSSEGKNEAIIKSNNVAINGLKQNAKGDNSLHIGK